MLLVLFRMYSTYYEVTSSFQAEDFLEIVQKSHEIFERYMESQEEAMFFDKTYKLNQRPIKTSERTLPKYFNG